MADRRSPLPAPTALALALTAATIAAAHDHAEEAQRIAELLDLRAGLIVADVGAGDGEWSEDIARRVGPEGHVYVNEIDAGELIKIRQRLSESELGNLSVVEGTADDTALAEGCCHAVLLRLVYHHLSHPAAMRASLRRALRPGGRLLVVEMDADGGHGIAIERLVDELAGDGFQVLSRQLRWGGHDDHYAVLLQR